MLNGVRFIAELLSTVSGEAGGGGRLERSRWTLVQ
jgi:hypothetical protein